jgi:hypothetical protein
MFKKDITKLDNCVLISHFKDAVMDDNYNPSSEDYNQSGFTLYELEQEVLRRMGGNINDDDDNY